MDEPYEHRSAAAWLDELAAAGRSDATLHELRKVLRWAETQIGAPLESASPEWWGQLRFPNSRTTRDVRARTLRRFLAWAGRPIPPALRFGDGRPGTSGPIGRMGKLAPRWAAAVQEWSESLTGTAGTVIVRRMALARLAGAMAPTGPWDVSTEDPARWLGSHHWAPSTARQNLAAVRSFYRFHQAAGRLPTDPSRALSTTNAA